MTLNIPHRDIFQRNAKAIKLNEIKLPVIVSYGRLILPGLVQSVEIPIENQEEVNKISRMQSTYDFGAKKVVILNTKNNEITKKKDISLMHVYSIGCVGYITGILPSEQTIKISIFPEARCLIKTLYYNEENILYSNALPISQQKLDSVNTDLLKEKCMKIKTMLITIMHLDRTRSAAISQILQDIEYGMSAGMVSDLCCNKSVTTYADNTLLYKVLLSLHSRARASGIINVLQNEINILKTIEETTVIVDSKIKAEKYKAAVKMQIQALQASLEEKDESRGQKEVLIKSAEDIIANNEVPQDIRKFISKCAYEFKNSHSESVDFSSRLVHLNTLIQFPWTSKQPKTFKMDIKSLKDALDQYMHGAPDVKQRILEILSMASVSKKLHATPICIVGKPGTGKTALASILAVSINKPLHKISLCGVSDSSVIKGNLRAYVGAACGKVAQYMILSKRKDCIILLDEIDKMNFSNSSNAWAAIMDLIDSEHNHTFLDSYLNCNIDCSHLIFIATANNLDSIPAPLIDRFECLYMQDYSLEDKIHICKKHIIPKVNSSFPEKIQYQISNKGLNEIAKQESSSIRQLKKNLVSIIQKHLTTNILKGNTANNYKITLSFVKKFFNNQQKFN